MIRESLALLLALTSITLHAGPYEDKGKGAKHHHHMQPDRPVKDAAYDGQGRLARVRTTDGTVVELRYEGASSKVVAVQIREPEE